MGGVGDDEADSLLKDDRVSNQNNQSLGSKGHHSPEGAVGASISTSRPVFNRTPNADKSRRQFLTPKSTGGKLVRRTLDYPETPIENASTFFDSRVTDPSIGFTHFGIMDDECQKWCRVSGILPGAVGGRSRVLHEMFDRDGKNGLIRIKESAGDTVLLQFRTKADAKLAHDSHKNDDINMLKIEQLNEQTALKLGLDVRINSDGVCDIDDSRCGGAAASRVPIVLRSFAMGAAGSGVDRAAVDGGQGQGFRPPGLKIITASTNPNSAGGDGSGDANSAVGGVGSTGLVHRPFGLRMEVSKSLTDPKFCAVRPIRRDSCCDRIMKFFSMVTSDQQGEDR
jgi:hypothetical protein